MLWVTPLPKVKVCSNQVLERVEGSTVQEKILRPTLQKMHLLKLQSSVLICNHYPFSPSFLHHGEIPTGCHSFDDHLSSNQDGGKSKNVVNLGAIRQGMKRFQFLLNCCEPGTIPDASILAAALDLVSCWKNLLTLSPIPVNSASRGKQESQILTLTLGYVFGFGFLSNSGKGIKKKLRWGERGKGRGKKY